MNTTNTQKQGVTVEFSTYEDARRVVLGCLDRLPIHARNQVAKAIVWRLRDARLLQQSIEQHYGATELASLLGRSAAWVVKWAKRGAFGAVSFDGGGWLIPASGVQAYLDAHSVPVKGPASG